MISKLVTLHSNLFARDKMLRHTYQHFEIALLALLVISFYYQSIPAITVFLVFVLFSYLPDLDGISSVFIWSKKIPVAHTVSSMIFKGDIKGALAYATVHHKKLNRLFLHNVFAYSFFVSAFVWSFVSMNYYLSIFLGALIGHFTFDIFDDIFQMGNIKNWLWPLHLIFPKVHWFDPNKISRPIPQLRKTMTLEPTDYMFGDDKEKK